MSCSDVECEQMGVKSIPFGRLQQIFILFHKCILSAYGVGKYFAIHTAKSHDGVLVERSHTASGEGYLFAINRGSSHFAPFAGGEVEHQSIGMHHSLAGVAGRCKSAPYQEFAVESGAHGLHASLWHLIQFFPLGAALEEVAPINFCRRLAVDIAAHKICFVVETASGGIVDSHRQRCQFAQKSSVILHMYAVAAFRRAVGIAAAYHHQAIGIAYCHAIGYRLGQRPESFPSERIAVAASAIDTAVVAFGASFGCRSVGKVGTACHHQVVSYLSGKAS